MNPIPLQYLLVIVISISQILGGVSCCCVGRAVAEAFIGATSRSSSEAVNGELSDSDAWQIGTCPKCRARHVAVATKVENPGARFDNRNKIGIDDQCRCTKLAIKATISKEPASLERDVREAVDFFSASAAEPERNPANVFRFSNKVPIRFGGRSWQAIACIWKI